MIDGVKPNEREIKALEIAFAGADVKGAMDKARTGKNGFIIQDDGKEIKLRPCKPLGPLWKAGSRYRQHGPTIPKH